MEPHFLYNTLASAQVLTRTDPPRADVMLGHLIHYLRSSLPRTDDRLSTLGEELERTLAYLEILKIRMGSRLSMQIEVPDALKSVPMPSMMLQTLVENAIKHGVEPLLVPGRIAIRAVESSPGRLRLEVQDNGKGLAPDRSPGLGVGTSNTLARLNQLYGSGAQFRLEAVPEGGVQAVVEMPLSR